MAPTTAKMARKYLISPSLPRAGNLSSPTTSRKSLPYPRPRSRKTVTQRFQKIPPSTLYKPPPHRQPKKLKHIKLPLRIRVKKMSPPLVVSTKPLKRARSSSVAALTPPKKRVRLTSEPRDIHSSVNSPTFKVNVDRKEEAIAGQEPFGVFLDPPEYVDATNATYKSKDDYEKRKYATPPTPWVNNDHVLASTKVNQSWKEMPASAQQGFHNPHILCYRNSLAQAILHHPELVGFLKVHHAQEKCVWKKTPCVACALRKVAVKYWAGESVVEPMKHLDQVCKKLQFGPALSREQADPEEQYNWIVSKLEEQLDEESFMTFSATVQPVLCIRRICSKCGAKSLNTGNVEGMLSVDLKPRVAQGDVLGYLKEHMKETITGFKCDSKKCNRREAEQTRTKLFEHSPAVLTVQLKRYTNQVVRNRVQLVKDFHPVKINPTLNLDSYRTTFNTTPSVYDLSAVIYHSGTLKYGHYVCAAKDGEEKWHLFNDNSVKDVKLKDVLSPAGPMAKDKSTSYLLFYSRRV